jgi:hypothetical protein
MRLGDFSDPKEVNDERGMMCGSLTIYYVFCKDCAFFTRTELYRFPMTYIILTSDFSINVLYDFLKFYLFTKD